MDFPALPLSYTALVNLKPKQRINALVLVVSSNSPKRTRFGDFFLTCFVVDPSLPEGEVLTNIFRKEGQTIPKLEPGSLVELQDVEVQFHNKRQQICANGLSKVFLHKFDATGQLDVSCPIINSYLKRLVSLWETKISAGSTIDQLVPSQASGRSDIPNYVPGQKFQIFQSIKPGVYVDLAVEVIKVGPQNSKFAEMIVTDYTENRLAQVSSRQIEGDLMTSGRPLDFTVTLWDEHAHSSYFLSAKEGTRLLLLNCKAKLSASGVLEMAIHGEGKSVSRKIYPLSEDLSHKISERKESIIQELKMARDEQPNNLTCIKYPDAPICELENILNCNKVPNHFRTKGRIVEVWPKDDGLGISAFCRRICESCEAFVSADALECNTECKSNSFKWVYQFSFLLAPLEQDSPVLHIMVSHQNAFLVDIPPTNLEKSLESRFKLKSRLRELMNKEIDICIISHYPDPKIRHQVAYRLFATSLSKKLISKTS